MTPVPARLRRGTIGATAAVALIVPLALVVGQPAMAAPEPPPPVQKLIADGETAVRISGPDRYETAARISLEFGAADVVHVASGTAFPDALSAQLPPTSAPTEDVLPGGLWPASHAGGGGAPTLLTQRDTLPSATVIGADHIGRLMNERNIIVSDMVGTSFDVGLVIEGRERVYEMDPVIDRFRVQVPYVAHW